jgi:uncharacterized protein
MAHVVAERTTPQMNTAAPAIANPAPLGLSAFALTTFVLSAANAGLFKGAAIVLGLALFYGGLTQLCAGMWEFRTGNTFGATAFSSYGGFWISLGFALLPIFGGKSLVELAGGGQAVGVFLLGWTIFTGIMFLGTFRLNFSLVAIFGFLFLTFLALTIGALSPDLQINSIGMTTYGGWLGLITAALAWYGALAQILTATNSPFKLPIFPLS